MQETGGNGLGVLPSPARGFGLKLADTAVIAGQALAADKPVAAKPAAGGAVGVEDRPTDVFEFSGSLPDDEDVE